MLYLFGELDTKPLALGLQRKARAVDHLGIHGWHPTLLDEVARALSALSACGRLVEGVRTEVA
jgi:hypothetical protein